MSSGKADKGKKKQKKPAKAEPAPGPAKEQVQATPAPVAAEKPAVADSKAVEHDDHGENPLESPWTLWYLNKLSRNPNQPYNDALKKMGSFTTVEGFWRHFSYLKQPEQMQRDQDVFLFRNNDLPAWETFPNGGVWIIKVRKKNGIINRLWEELCFAAIGESFEEPEVAGVALSSRGREDNLAVWVRDNSNDVYMSIGDKLRLILNLDESTKPEYQTNKVAIKEGSTYRKTVPYVYALQGFPPATGGPIGVPLGSLPIAPFPSESSAPSTSDKPAKTDKAAKPSETDTQKSRPAADKQPKAEAPKAAAQSGSKPAKTEKPAEPAKTEKPADKQAQKQAPKYVQKEEAAPISKGKEQPKPAPAPAAKAASAPAPAKKAEAKADTSKAGAKPAPKAAEPAPKQPAKPVAKAPEPAPKAEEEEDEEADEEGD